MLLGSWKVVEISVTKRVGIVYCALCSANLDIVRELNDHVAEGRACGNLGNTHYLLGNFSLAVSFHQEVIHCHFVQYNT